MKHTLILTKKVSSKTDKPYFMLTADLGYRRQPLTFEPDVIAILLDKPVSYVLNLDVGEWAVGEIIL